MTPNHKSTTATYQANKLLSDEFGRKSGILIIDKPVGKSSHQIVSSVRKKLDIKKVGHAGALDPFASGLLVILVGKATKFSDSFLHLDKEYEAAVLLGISTDSGDIEGDIEQIKAGKKVIEPKSIKRILQKFKPGYEQFVPVFSSVKVEGQKLRKLARQYDNFEIKIMDNSKFVHFQQNGKIAKEVRLPSKPVKIYNIELLEVKELKGSQVRDLFEKWIDTKEKSDVSMNKYTINEIDEGTVFQIAKIRVKCSKGTYIRQLGVDIGEKLGVPACLVGLRRTKIGEFGVGSTTNLNDLENLK